MNRSFLSPILLTAAALLVLVPAAPGAAIVYTDRAAFGAAVTAQYGPPTIDGYETYPNDLQSGVRILTLTYFNVSYNLAGDVSDFGISDVPNPNGGSGIGPTAGTKYLLANYPTASGPPGVTVSFLFGTGIHAFGTDIKDLENANLSFSTDSGASGIAALPGSDGNVQFFGIISDAAFTSIGFSEPPASTGDGVVFDQATFAGTSVPEPSSLALAGTAVLIALAGAWRRRQRVAKMAN